MVDQNIVKTIAIITIFISLLFSLFLLTVKTKNKLSNSVLAGFILFCSVDIFGLFLNQNNTLFLFSKAFTFLIFPALYLYVLSICSISFKLKTKHLIHTLPFITYIAIVPFYLYTIKFNNNGTSAIVFSKTIWFYNVLLLKIQAFSYIIASTFILRKHRKIYLENYSEGDISIYKLLSQIILIFIITFPVTLVKEIIPYTKYYQAFNWVIVGLISIALFMFCWFIFKALHNPKLFRGVDLRLAASNTIYPKNSDQKSEMEELRLYMIEKEPFINSELSLQDLSFQLKMPPRTLSSIINNQTGQHFFDFVNEYRIEKAKELLKNFSNNKLTIQQVFYDIGFNSKSSFNTAFKKHTGVTPTEFKKKFQ
jgi:AraC-like DNA-binding protein